MSHFIVLGLTSRKEKKTHKSVDCRFIVHTETDTHGTWSLLLCGSAAHQRSVLEHCMRNYMQESRL